jgi:formylmethanofuran dehydrogenase subunit B
MTTLPSGSQPSTMTDVPCPFCGLLCDDLDVTAANGRLAVVKNGCPKAIDGFERTLPSATPSIAGRPVSHDEAIAKAAHLIAAAGLPLLGGLATDVEGMRAVMSLADRTGAVIDHALSESAYRNYKVLQTSGWAMTTLTEVRNRADLIVVVATDIHAAAPRFFERMVGNQETMFDDTPKKRTVVLIGQGFDVSRFAGSRIGEVITLNCANEAVGAVVSALRARLKGQSVHAPTVAGVAMSAIDNLADRCHAAQYGVFVWAPGSLDFPNADLTVHAICETVRELNVSQRFAGLSIGGSAGLTSAVAVSSWQSGYPLRVSFASGKPDYDPERYAIPKMLASGDGDVLVWINALAVDIPVPKTRIPEIVIATPGVVMNAVPDVFIPVGTPGLDHAGRLIRCDNVVSLPMRNLGRSTLPSVADVISAIETQLASTSR